MYIFVYVYMYICIYVYMYICIYVYMYICIYAYMYICIYVYMYICIYVYMYICIYVSMYICIYVYMYMCIYVYMYICIYVYIYVYMYICIYVYMYICTYVYVYTYVRMYICIYVYMYILRSTFSPGSSSRSHVPVCKGMIVRSQFKGLRRAKRCAGHHCLDAISGKQLLRILWTGHSEVERCFQYSFNIEQGSHTIWGRAGNLHEQVSFQIGSGALEERAARDQVNNCRLGP